QTPARVALNGLWGMVVRSSLGAHSLRDPALGDPMLARKTSLLLFAPSLLIVLAPQACAVGNEVDEASLGTVGAPSGSGTDGMTTGTNGTSSSAGTGGVATTAVTAMGSSSSSSSTDPSSSASSSSGSTGSQPD